uniref:G patch domain-containing protein 4 n=1 Tax=Cuerna arida TaxID=1464854 RepID=A0A1B6G7T1_9HEMI
MEFSKRYLLKYGWTEGEGLGKTESGIKSAIKPKLKFDKAGVGYNHSIEFTDRWWENIYNTALSTTTIQDVEENKIAVEVHHKKKKKRKKNPEGSENLYEACEGRTAHKGARHGLQLSAKLHRLEQQEKMLLQGKNNSFMEVSAHQVVDKSEAEKSEKESHLCKQSLSEGDGLNNVSSDRGYDSSNYIKTIESEQRTKKCKRKRHKDSK